MRKYIISGAAGTGKTSLINEIENQNILIIPEASRQIIIEEQKHKRDGMPWANLERFTELVVQKSMFFLQNHQEAIFCDRSMIDSIAYLIHQGKSIPVELATFPFEEYYHNQVFFALPWREIYQTDQQRPEPFEYHLSLSKVLIETYQTYGFDLIKIPFGTVQDRLNFVFEKTCL
jgi:predicted ATPase